MTATMMLRTAIIRITMITTISMTITSGTRRLQRRRERDRMMSLGGGVGGNGSDGGSQDDYGNEMEEEEGLKDEQNAWKEKEEDRIRWYFVVDWWP